MKTYFLFLVSPFLLSLSVKAQNTSVSTAEQTPKMNKQSGGYIRPSYNFMDNITAVNDIDFKGENFEAKMSEMRFDFQSTPGLAVGYQWKQSTSLSLLAGAFLEKERVLNGMSGKMKVTVPGTTLSGQSSFHAGSPNDSTTLSVWGAEFGARFHRENLYFPVGTQLSQLSISGPGIKDDQLKNQWGMNLYGGVGYSFFQNVSIEGILQNSFYHIKWPQAENHTLFSGIGAVARFQVLL